MDTISSDCAGRIATSLSRLLNKIIPLAQRLLSQQPPGDVTAIEKALARAGQIHKLVRRSLHVAKRHADQLNAPQKRAISDNLLTIELLVLGWHSVIRDNRTRTSEQLAEVGCVMLDKGRVILKEILALLDAHKPPQARKKPKGRTANPNLVVWYNQIVKMADDLGITQERALAAFNKERGTSYTLDAFRKWGQRGRKAVRSPEDQAA